MAECPKCSEKLYEIRGLSSEPEGIRPDYFCDECNIVYTCTKAHFRKRLILKPPYEPDVKEKIRNLCERILEELDEMEE